MNTRGKFQCLVRWGSNTVLFKVPTLITPPIEDAAENGPARATTH